MRLRVYTRAHTRAVNVPRRGPQVCEAFWTLSRNAEWVMHPAQARRRQMNYNISFSRPYIPTDKAYWRSLIAFNSLLVHPCNGLEETHSRRVTIVISVFSFFFHRSPNCRSAPFAHFLPLPSIPSIYQTSPRCQDYYYYCCFLFSLFFPLRRRDRLTLMQPLIVPDDRREVLGSQPVACLPCTQDILLPKRTTADKRSPPQMTNERVPPHNCGSSRTSQIKSGLLARSLVRRCCRLFAHRNVSEMHICESSRAAIGRSDNNKTDERGSSRCGDPSMSLHSHLNFDLRSNGRLRNHLDDESKLKIYIPVSRVTL